MINIIQINKIAENLVNDVDHNYSIFPKSKNELIKLINTESSYKDSSTINFLPLNRLNSEKEKEDCLNIISEVIQTGSFTSGPYLNRIEKKLKAEYNAKHCIATSSGTDALTIALKSIDISYGDQVIVPPNSFAASENAIFLWELILYTST
ncbi:hypothetical protein B9G39_28150 [Zooshikella ganghwensis]|uniref:Aminotransferase class I/II-fold pyridoxal phosphate-dependent enzyme n=1 Tax=Zooshikella ganghwensis TaxID=202772 RepID=A0A4V1IMU9_9GAMM|nr:hypothetical protein B9G39_28150 [Zooshikella ganghwensis]